MLVSTKSSTTATRLLGLASLFALAVPEATRSAEAAVPTDRCTQTASAADTACRKEAAGDYWLAEGICENVPAPAARAACIRDAKDERQSAVEDCAAQLAAREGLCDEIGQAAYAPSVNPANFTTTIDNPFLPWVPGTIFVYESSEGEVVTVTVLEETAEIGGVETVIVHDAATIGGVLVEDTYDYYAQDLQGNVWYFGEDTVEYEEGRIVSVEGAWRTGVDGAKPGIVMKANPMVGDVYRQEFALGEAEDDAEVVSLNATATVPAGTFNGCIKTDDQSALEPDIDESKFYASGVGLVLAVNNESGEREELVSVTGP